MIVVIVLVGCVVSECGDGGGEGFGDVDGMFVFVVLFDLVSFDLVFVQDGEMFCVFWQIFEGFVGIELGIVDLVLLLVELWELFEDGMLYIFVLKEDVMFQDGILFNVEVVCVNFDCWYNWIGLVVFEVFGYYYNKFFKGYVFNFVDVVYKLCMLDGDNFVMIELNKLFVGFIVLLLLFVFVMQSLFVMQEFGVDEVGGFVEVLQLFEYVMGYFVGIGFYQFDEWVLGEQVILKVYDGYWGEVGQIDEIIFCMIDDLIVCCQVFEFGLIDGYDFVGLVDMKVFVDDDFMMVLCFLFMIFYFVFNQVVLEFQDFKVCEVFFYVVDKDVLISQVFLEGIEKVMQFVFEVVNGYNFDVKIYDYDFEKVKFLLVEVGYDEFNLLKLIFNYLVNVLCLYMLDFEQIYMVLLLQFIEVGVEIILVFEEWVEYFDCMIGMLDYGIYLFGWIGDYNDIDNFVGVFFGQKSLEWGFDNLELFQKLIEVCGVFNFDEQMVLYEDINEMVVEFIFGVLFVYLVLIFVFDLCVESYFVSLVNDEVFMDIVFIKQV